MASRNAPSCAELTGEAPTPEEHPLLPANPEEDVLWNDVEQANPSCNLNAAAQDSVTAELEEECSVEELLRDRPQHLLSFLQDHGVKCLGAFEIEVGCPIPKLSALLAMQASHCCVFVASLG
jgi:hypothetical protein